MGQLKSDGNATLGGITFPAGQFNFGELFRVGGISGFILKTINTADTDRNADMEISPARIWYINVPAAVAAVAGTYLYWATAAPATLQRGDTNLTATVAGVPAVFVEETKDAGNVAAVRVLNIGPSGA